jgi:hypothetical protein
MKEFGVGDVSIEVVFTMSRDMSDGNATRDG